MVHTYPYLKGSLNQNSSTIDYFFTNQNHLIDIEQRSIEILNDIDSSDHFPILLNLKLKKRFMLQTKLLFNLIKRNSNNIHYN